MKQLVDMMRTKNLTFTYYASLNWAKYNPGIYSNIVKRPMTMHIWPMLL